VGAVPDETVLGERGVGRRDEPSADGVAQDLQICGAFADVEGYGGIHGVRDS
jgi:hypothetical protein